MAAEYIDQAEVPEPCVQDTYGTDHLERHPDPMVSKSCAERQDNAADASDEQEQAGNAATPAIRCHTVHDNDAPTGTGSAARAVPRPGSRCTTVKTHAST